MKKFPLLLTFILFLTFLWGCGQWGVGLPEQIIAQINEEQIPVEEFNREFRELVLESGKEVGGKGFGNLKQAYLEQVIERKILVGKSTRRT
jgi:outer membrane lipoprotein-sorting protein